MTNSADGMEKQGVIKKGVTPEEVRPNVKRAGDADLEDHVTTRLAARLAEKRPSKT